MKKAMVIVLALVFALSFAGCQFSPIFVIGSDLIVPVPITKQPSDFTRVSASQSIVVSISPNAGYGLAISANDNLIEYLTCEVVGGVLVLGFQPGYSISNVKVTATVQMPLLEGVSATTDASVAFGDFGAIASMEVSATTDAVVNGIVGSSGPVTVDATTDAFVTLSGAAGSLDITETTRADVDLLALTAPTATIDLTTNAVCELNVSDTITGTITTGATLRYRGTPWLIIQNTGGKFENI